MHGNLEEGKQRLEQRTLHPTDLLPNYHREKKKVKKPEQFSHSSAKREDERFGRNILAHLNLTFNSLNVLLDLAKGAALSHGAAGILIRTLPSLLQR